MLFTEPSFSVKKKINKPASNDIAILKSMADAIEKNPVQIFNPFSLIYAYQAKRRSLFDFLSIVGVFGICEKLTAESYKWKGLNAALSSLSMIKQELEEQAKEMSLLEIMDCSSSPTLQNITIAVMKLFLYLNVDKLDLRDMGKILSKGKVKYKTMLRKLYTVASCLEIAKIISRTSVVAEIKLNFSIDSIKIIPQHDSLKSLSISSLLNGGETKKEENISYESRRKMYNDILGNKISIHFPIISIDTLMINNIGSLIKNIHCGNSFS